MPAGKVVQFRGQERFVIWCVLETEHDWCRSGRGKRVQQTQERSNGKRQHLHRSRRYVGKGCGEHGEQSCAETQKWVDEEPIAKIVATRKSSIRHHTNAPTRR